jgi:hypothetical protein
MAKDGLRLANLLSAAVEMLGGDDQINGWLQSLIG